MPKRDRSRVQRAAQPDRVGPAFACRAALATNGLQMITLIGLQVGDPIV